MLTRLGWILKRLRVMGLAEIVHRIRQVVVGAGLYARYRLGRGGKPLPDGFWRSVAFCRGDRPLIGSLPWTCPDSETADRLRAGRLTVLGCDWQWEDDEACWHIAPDTGKSWPRGFFGTLAFRGDDAAGDIRVAWEYGRLQQLTALAVYAAHGPERSAPAAVSAIEAQFLSWVRANPPAMGIHYVSAMECALRLMAVTHALDLARGRLKQPAAVWPAMLEMVVHHARLIERRLSLHSSAGNHTVAEAAGLIYAGALFPELDGAARWLDTGVSLLTREADRQILPDGGGIEQTTWYQAFVVELVALAINVLASRRLGVPPALEAALRRGRNYLKTLGRSRDTLPGLGDSDSGYALSPWLALIWLGGEGSEASPQTFPQTGLTAMRAVEPDSFGVVFDHGPLGMAPLFAHGHADALSLLISVGEHPLTIDTGTYTYGGDPLWRRYFRSTAAHNTLVLDNEDQAAQETNFIWKHPYDATLIHRAVDDPARPVLVARHDGYRHLGITHWRGIACLAPGFLLVLDVVTGTGEHDLAVHWHFAGDVRLAGNAVATSAGGVPVTMTAGSGPLRAFTGSDDPVLGWYSPGYGRMTPITTVVSSHRSSPPVELVTTFSIDGATMEQAGLDEALDLMRNQIC